MKILYNTPTETREFDMAEYLDSLHEFDNSITREQVEKALNEFPYNPLHHSCLIEIGVNLIQNENQAKAYFTKYRGSERGFERLVRLTGYLTGDYRRANDAKKHEIAERVVHGVSGKDGVFTQAEKNAKEAQKLAYSAIAAQMGGAKV